MTAGQIAEHNYRPISPTSLLTRILMAGGLLVVWAICAAAGTGHRDCPLALDTTALPQNYSTPDAFILTPRQELEPGVYLVLVRGENAGVITQGQGGALFRVGPKHALRGAITAGVKAATENLNRHELGDLPGGQP